MKSQRFPTKITLDAYAGSHRAVADLKESGELLKRVRVRTSKYLNNRIEQAHRRVKRRLRPMLGLKSFRTAVIVIAGIELAEKIKKRQFKIANATEYSDDAGNLANRLGLLKQPRTSKTSRAVRIESLSQFAPEPHCKDARSHFLAAISEAHH